MIVVNTRLGVHGRYDSRLQDSSFFRGFLRHHVTSPPAITILWPVILSAPGPQSHNTVCATSSGVIRRFCGFVANGAPSASESQRAVFRMMFVVASRRMSVHV